MEFALRGLSATVEPANPVVPKNTRSGVRIQIRAGPEELTASEAARFLGPDFEVLADLSGPGLSEAVGLPQPFDLPPADPLLLLLPPLPLAGDYTLSNIRIEAGGKPVLDVEPRSITVQVIPQVLITSVQTRPLTLDELKERGVVFDSDDFLGFEFTLAMQLESKPVQVQFPVVFDRQGVAVPRPIEPPAEPRRTGVPVDLPSMPTIIPLLLESEDGGPRPKVRLPNGTEQEVRIPSIVVIPGNVGFLKQFFSAQLFVANGAPAGSGLLVDAIEATIGLPVGEDGAPGTPQDPGDDPLALPELAESFQPATLAVVGVGPDGTPGTSDDVSRLNPGEQAQAEFLIRGEREGFHTIDFDIRARLEGLPTGPVNVVGKASGGVLVRNPFFNLTFTVPSVVREQEEFSLFVTVHNIGEAFANDVRVSVDNAALSGVELLGDATQSIATLVGGDSETLEYRFGSLRTGQVVASYLELEGGLADGNLKFTLGVGERGVPLSPDTLVLPASVAALEPPPGSGLPSVVKAAMRVLGQAWSVANAPAGTLPPSVIRINKNLVIEKALALAEAGLRVELGQERTLALRDLGFDFWSGRGGRLERGFDQLLRETEAGWNLSRALGAELAAPMEASGGVVAYERELARVAASGPDFLTFAVGMGSQGAAVELKVTDGAGRVSENGLSAAPPASAVPGLVMIPLGSPGSAPVLGILTSPTSSPYTLELTGLDADTAEVVVTLPRGDGSFLRATTSVSVNAQSRARVAVDLFRSDILLLELDLDGDGIFETESGFTEEILSPEGPRLVSATLIGPEVLDGASPFGFHAALLFDRPVEEASGGNPGNYVIPRNALRGAKRQLSGRLVFTSLAQPEGPYIPATVTVSGVRDGRGVAMPEETVALGSRLLDPGAVVTGRVLDADGTPVSQAAVTYTNRQADRQCTAPVELAFAELPLAEDGSYEFRYVRQDHCGGPFRILNREQSSGAVRSVSSFVRAAGELIHLDLVLFGTGSVSGQVTESDVAVPGAKVVVVSGTDPQSGGVTETDGDGRYIVSGILVGPVSVKAAKGARLGSNSGRIGRAGTTAPVDVRLEPGSVRAQGKVERLSGGITSPIPGVHVVYSLKDTARQQVIPVGVVQTGPDGTFSIESLPPGDFILEAIASHEERAKVEGNAAPGDVIDERLVIVTPPSSELATVKGVVVLPNGDAVEGAVVTLGRGVLSAADGSFTLTDVPVAPLRAQTILARTRDGKRSGTASVLVSEAGQQIENVRITLSGLGKARFEVRDARGNAVVGQEVGLLGNCGNPCGCSARTTGQDGSVTFEDVPLGTVFAQAVLFGPGFTDVASGSASIVQDGETGVGVLQFRGTGTVRGKVFLPGVPGMDDEPAHGAEVTLRSLVFDFDSCGLRQGISHSVKTDTAGGYEFRNVVLGQVAPSATFFLFPTPVGQQGTLSEVDGAVELNLKLVDQVAGVLSGTVFLPDGVTPAGSGIEVTAEGPLPEVTVKTDADGNYRFADRIFPQGFYDLTAQDPRTGWVRREKIFLRAEEDVTHDLRLKGRGTVRVKVVEGADRPVGQAFVRLTETEFPGRVHEGAIEPANEGVVTFGSVFEGPFSVEAFDAFARNTGGRIPSVLPGPGESVEVKVRLTLTGTVEGHFLMPPSDTPIPLGTVKLIAGGRVIGQTTTLASGDVGFFRFSYVPAGPVRLEAVDFLTARTGVAVGTMEEQDQVLPLDVRAQGLGNVEGFVRTSSGVQPEAHVDLVSGTFRACTIADGGGFYQFQGVPEGRVVVTGSLGNGFLAGTASGTLSGEGATLELDVELRSSGEVRGEVLRAGGGGPAPPSLVSIQVGGAGGGTQSTTTDGNGEFSFARVPSGLVTLTVDVLGSIDRAKAAVEVMANESVHVPLTLNGVGSIRGRAEDSDGQPVEGLVTLTGTGDFPYSITVQLPSDGLFFLPEVLAGPMTAKLRAQPSGFVRFGTQSKLVEPDVENLLTLRLEDSGTVTGVVRRADGTGALGAQVTLKLDGGRGSLTLQAQEGGVFTSQGVPLGEFSITVADPLTAGVGKLENLTLSANEEILDVGEILLDDSPIEVVSISPPDGASDIAETEPIVIRFSDPVGSFAGAVSVKRGNTSVALTSSLSADGLTLTLTGTLPHSVELTVTVSTALTDILGRRLQQAFVSRFRTVDLSPPKVVAFSPSSGAIQVSVGTEVEVSFDEPLDEALSDLPALITLSGPGGPVTGSTTLSGPDVAVFTPDLPLLDNAIYAISVNGQADARGNKASVATTSSFATPDTVAPALSLTSPAAGSWVSSARPTIRVSLSDAVSGFALPPPVSLELDGEAVIPDQVLPTQMSFTPKVDLPEGQHEVLAMAADRAGNVGAFSASFGVDTVAPSAGEILSPLEGETLRGSVTFRAASSDGTSGLARIEIRRSGSLVTSLLPPTFETVLNSALLPEGPVTLTARAVDLAGNVGLEGAPVSVVVDNQPLVLTFKTPAAGARFRQEVDVSVTVSEAVSLVRFEVGAELLEDTESDYEARLDLSQVAEGPATIRATGFGLRGDVATAERDIVVDRTPPLPPDGDLITAEPPESGFSLVLGRARAVEAGARVDATNTAKGATAFATADPDGSFFLSIGAAVDDALSLTATDSVGNVSAATTVVVRRTPSLPPSTGSTSLRFEGVLVDRVGPGGGGPALAPDGDLDAVFTMSVDVGQGVTRTLDFIELEGPVTRSTRPVVGSILGVAAEAGGPFLNDADGQVSFPITSGATLTLFAADQGFIREGETYTVTAGFTDGARFVGSFTLVPASDQNLVAHSVMIEASPPAVLATGSAPGVSVLTLSELRDIEGVLVPDGTKVALAVADMASTDPRGTPIRSAGGTILDGDPAANHGDFRVFTISGGEVVATYSSEPVSPASRLGAVAVIQVLAADGDGNVLGTKAIGTFDLSLRDPSDSAVVKLSAPSLYADQAARRSQLEVEVRDALGNPVPNGTKVLLSAAFCAARVNNACVGSAGGQIVGGAQSPTSTIYRAFEVTGGVVLAEYSADTVSVAPGGVAAVNVQVLPSDANGARTSTEALGTGSLSLVGAAGSEIKVSPSSVPFVFPERPAQIRVHHVHDSRGNLVPDGANFLLSVAFCAARMNGVCVNSAGGAIPEGQVSPTSTIYKFLPLAQGEIAATYSTEGVSAAPGEVNTANIQLLMGDPSGARLSTEAVAVKELQVVAPSHAVGAAEPPSLLADGGLHTSSVTFGPVLDAVGNPLPEGSRVLAAVAFCAARINGVCVPSDGGQILNGDFSPTGAQYKVLTVENGAVTALYGNQNVTSVPGQVKTANVVLVESGAGGEVLSTEAMGVVGVALPGLTSAVATASVTSIHADGGDHRSVVTLTDVRDARGEPAPEGTLVALSAQFCASRINGACVSSAGGKIVGGATSPTLASHYQLFPVQNGQIVAEYSSEGVSVASGQATATVQAVSVTAGAAFLSSEAIATVPIELVAPESALVAASPMDLLADGGARLSQVTVREILDALGQPIPNGAKVGLTAASCAARDASNQCVISSGGQILSAGVTPGDGSPASNNTNFRVFTVAGGEVRAVYSAEGLTSGVDETKTARVAVVPASSAGATLSTTALGVGTIHLHGTTSATASGAPSLPAGGAQGTVTFTGIKDSAGNAVPDGTLVLATASSCATVDANNQCNLSSGGTIVDGQAHSDSRFKLFNVVNGSVSVTYSTTGASSGTARVQLAPATSQGVRIGNRSLIGGVWAITIVP